MRSDVMHATIQTQQVFRIYLKLNNPAFAKFIVKPDRERESDSAPRPPGRARERDRHRTSAGLQGEAPRILREGRAQALGPPGSGQRAKKLRADIEVKSAPTATIINNAHTHDRNPSLHSSSNSSSSIDLHFQPRAPRPLSSTLGWLGVGRSGGEMLPARAGAFFGLTRAVD